MIDVLALVGNALVIGFVILRARELRTREMNWFVANLASFSRSSGSYHCHSVLNTGDASFIINTAKRILGLRQLFFLHLFYHEPNHSSFGPVLRHS